MLVAHLTLLVVLQVNSVAEEPRGMHDSQPLTLEATILHTDTITVLDTAQPRLTSATLDSLRAVLRELVPLVQTPDVQLALHAYKTSMPITVARFDGDSTIRSKIPSVVDVPNFIDIAAHVPAVAQAFATAGMTPRTYMQISRALFCATGTDLLDRFVHSGPSSAVDPTTTLGQNIIWVRENTYALVDLMDNASGVLFSMYVTGGQR